METVENYKNYENSTYLDIFLFYFCLCLSLCLSLSLILCFSLYFSIDFKKKSPETIKKKSTEMLPPLNLSDRIGKKPWKYATQTEHKNLTSSMRPFLLLLFVILHSKDLIDAAILVYHNLS